MGCGVVAAKEACEARLGDVFRNVGCCEGIPAGEIGGTGAFDDCASAGPEPVHSPKPLGSPFGEPAGEFP